MRSMVDSFVWTGGASQVETLADGFWVLHLCIRPVCGASCAPGHHGHARATEQIFWLASLGCSCRMLQIAPDKTGSPSSFHSCRPRGESLFQSGMIYPPNTFPCLIKAGLSPSRPAFIGRRRVEALSRPAHFRAAQLGLALITPRMTPSSGGLGRGIFVAPVLEVATMSEH